MINIFSQYWEGADDFVREAINRNLKLEGVKLFLFLENDPDTSWLEESTSSLEIIHSPVRVTYGDFLRMVSSMPEGEICIFVNSDIIIPQPTLANLPDFSSRVALAISRREIDGTLPSSKEGTRPDNCQDIWILKSHQISEELLQVTSIIQAGRPGCENRFAAELAIDGYFVYNPCVDLIFTHNSSTQAQSYSDPNDPRRYNGLYAFISPCSIHDIETVNYRKLLSYYPKVKGVW